MCTCANATSPVWVISQYDLSSSTYSPDGRIFQVEYANKAVENSGCVFLVLLFSVRLKKRRLLRVHSTRSRCSVPLALKQPETQRTKQNGSCHQGQGWRCPRCRETRGFKAPCPWCKPTHSNRWNARWRGMKRIYPKEPNVSLTPGNNRHPLVSWQTLVI